MKDGNKMKKTISAEKIRAVIARVLLVAVACAGIVYAADTGTTVNTDEKNCKTAVLKKGRLLQSPIYRPQR